MLNSLIYNEPKTKKLIFKSYVNIFIQLKHFLIKYLIPMRPLWRSITSINLKRFPLKTVYIIVVGSISINNLKRGDKFHHSICKISKIGRKVGNGFS